MSKSHAQIYEAILATKGDDSTYPSMCTVRKQPRRPWSKMLSMLVSTPSGTNQSPGPSLPGASSAGSTNTTRASFPAGSSNTSVQNQSHNTSQHTSTTVQTNHVIVVDPPPKFVLIGTKDPRRTMKTAQLEIKQEHDDRHFIRRVKEEHKQLRGFCRDWLSVWILETCDYVKVGSNPHNDVPQG